MRVTVICPYPVKKQIAIPNVLKKNRPDPIDNPDNVGQVIFPFEIYRNY